MENLKTTSWVQKGSGNHIQKSSLLHEVIEIHGKVVIGLSDIIMGLSPG